MTTELDEEYGAAVLRPLDREPSGPPAIDVGRAIAAGRRHRVRVALAGSLAAVAATGLVIGVGAAVVQRTGRTPAPVVAAAPHTGAPSPTVQEGPPAPTACTLARLPLPSGQGTKSVVTGGDPSGRYIVGRSYPNDRQSHPVLLWDNGQVHTVAMSGSDQNLNDINSSGVAVGTSYVGTSTKVMAWVYQDGRLTRLAGDNASAVGINERGEIAGSVDDKPAIWRSASAQPTMLALPGSGASGIASAIDEDGTVVGKVQSSSGAQPGIGYEWLPDGTGRELPVPTANGKPVTEFTAVAIRDGWVAGWASQDVSDGSNIYAPRWNLRTGEVDITKSSKMVLVEDINAQGWIAGEIGTRAELIAGSDRVDLPDLGSTEQPSDNIAYTISDDGRTLAGQVEGSDGQPVAAVWHCH